MISTGSHPIRTGLDRLLSEPEALGGRSFGLLAHGPSVTADLVPIHLALIAAGAQPAALFGPEHGYYGVEQDMVASADESDPWTGLPIASLYGDSECSLRPRANAFDGLDLLVVDLQDVGSRYYTYAATAVWAAEVALGAGVEVWILDRPNPLGGAVVEGAGRGDGFESFVGAFDTPVRHGLTLGELVALEAGRRGWSDGWAVWAMEGWSRDLTWSALNRPWIAPSPNMPTFDTAIVYPGGCLVEATTVSEGRGTTRPFHLVGAPHLDPMRFAERLMDTRTPGVTAVPTYFKPQFQKHARAVCGGVEIVVSDPGIFPAYRFGIRVLEALWTELGSKLGAEGFWRPDPYEFVSDIPAIDLLTGGDFFRRALEAGQPLDPWLDRWPSAEDAFRDECGPILLYDTAERE